MPCKLQVVKPMVTSIIAINKKSHNIFLTGKIEMGFSHVMVKGINMKNNLKKLKR
jgi:hypothetical protein